MTQTKIEGKFYPLTSEVATKLRQAKLTAAEWRIWSYLVEVDPWGDRYVDIETLTVMQECNCSKATFYRAIAKFQKLKLFDFQDKGFSLKNETGVSKMRQLSQKCENQSPEPSQPEDFSESQTCSEFSNLDQTLSDERAEKSSFNWKDEIQPNERKSFRGFCRLMGEQLPKPVRLLDSWINANFEELNGLYQERYGKDKSSVASVTLKNTEQLHSGKQELCSAIESALSNGTIIDIYYSSIHDCECVVTKRRETIPVTKWLEGNEYAKLPY